MKRVMSIIFAAMLLVQMSCGFGNLFEHVLLVEPPALPEVWKGLKIDAYLLEWRDSDGNPRTAQLPPGGGMALGVARGLPQTILAYPLASGCRLKPAGLLYPADCAGDPDALPSQEPTRVRLSYASGYAAEVGRKIEASGLDAAAFPLKRLEASWSDKGKDPWTLQPWKAAKALAEGAFRVTLFPAPSANVRLPEGTWYPESPFCRLNVVEGGVREALLPKGLCLFYGESGLVEIQVGEDGGALVVVNVR